MVGDSASKRPAGAVPARRRCAPPSGQCDQALTVSRPRELVDRDAARLRQSSLPESTSNEDNVAPKAEYASTCLSPDRQAGGTSAARGRTWRSSVPSPATTRRAFSGRLSGTRSDSRSVPSAHRDRLVGIERPAHSAARLDRGELTPAARHDESPGGRPRGVLVAAEQALRPVRLHDPRPFRRVNQQPALRREAAAAAGPSSASGRIASPIQSVNASPGGVNARRSGRRPRRPPSPAGEATRAPRRRRRRFVEAAARHAPAALHRLGLVRRGSLARAAPPAGPRSRLRLQTGSERVQSTPEAGVHRAAREVEHRGDLAGRVLEHVARPTTAR